MNLTWYQCRRCGQTMYGDPTSTPYCPDCDYDDGGEE